MLKDEEMLHGAALLRLLESDDIADTTIHFSKGIHASAYRVSRAGAHIGILLKLSTMRKSPWPFVFTRWETDAIDLYKELHPRERFFVGLICHRDGVCCAPVEALVDLLDSDETLDGKRVAVRRPPGGSYWLSGPHRVKAERCIPMNAWPQSLFSRSAK